MNEVCYKCSTCHYYSDDTVEECKGQSKPCHEYSEGIAYRQWKLKGEANGWLKKVSPDRNGDDDLISRKDLIGTERLLMTDIVENNEVAKYILEQVLYDIEHAPAAFDKEKVITEMKKNSHNFYPSIDHYCLSQKAVDLKNAIEIVEKGGIE